jgi:predicted PurR-regulated permease PerM
VKLPRPLWAAIVLGAVSVGAGWSIYGRRYQAAALGVDLPEAARRVRERFEAKRPQAGGAIDKVQKAASEIEKAAIAATPTPATPGVQRVRVEEPPLNMASYVWAGSVGAATAFGQLMLIIFLVYFLLASGDLYRRKLVKIVGPSLTKKKITLQILGEIDRQIATFLLVQVFTSVVVGAASWIAFHMMGLEQAAVWGVAAGIFNSIPYLGPVLVSGGVTAIAFLQFNDLPHSLMIGGVALGITSVEGMLLTPWLTSRAARMNAVAVFINILFWGWVWGVWGALLAVPMLMVVKAVCDRVDDFKSVAELIGD